MEVYAWPEGTIYLYTGTATASALVAYAQNLRASIGRGWDNYRTLTGLYQDALTGLRADVQIGTFYTTDNVTLTRMFESATAVHMHLKHGSTTIGTAGVFLYSGRLDNIEIAGSDGELFRYAVNYHANAWSAYG